MRQSKTVKLWYRLTDGRTKKKTSILWLTRYNRDLLEWFTDKNSTTFLEVQATKVAREYFEDDGGQVFSGETPPFVVEIFRGDDKKFFCKVEVKLIFRPIFHAKVLTNSTGASEGE